MLRTLTSRAREDREAGFTLIEILVAMVLMAIIMSSLAVFFIGAQKSDSALRDTAERHDRRRRSPWTRCTRSTSTKILTGRDKTTSDTQWAAPPVTGVDVSAMTELYDTAARHRCRRDGQAADLSDDLDGQRVLLPGQLLHRPVLHPQRWRRLREGQAGGQRRGDGSGHRRGQLDRPR